MAAQRLITQCWVVMYSYY